MVTGKHKLTGPQRDLMEGLASGRFYIAGPEVRTARKLQSLGYLKLEDNGQMIIGRRSDNERWSAELTEAGIAALKEDSES